MNKASTEENRGNFPIPSELRPALQRFMESGRPIKLFKTVRNEPIRLRICYHIRKLYCIVHPLINHETVRGPDGKVIKWSTCRTQWVMRASPLVQHGVPFFFEPWVNPDDWREKPKPNIWEVTVRFVKEFRRWRQAKHYVDRLDG